MSGSARTCYAAREASPATSDTTQPTRARSAAELTIITVRTVHVASPVHIQLTVRLRPAVCDSVSGRGHPSTICDDQGRQSQRKRRY